jgi:hypothetical protein
MVLLNLNEKQKEKIVVFNQFDDSSIGSFLPLLSYYLESDKKNFLLG